VNESAEVCSVVVDPVVVGVSPTRPGSPGRPASGVTAGGGTTAPAAAGSGGRSRRGFTALLVAETVSTAGTRMSQLALPWLVLTTTHNPVTTGLVGLAEIAPYVVLQILGAPLVDSLGGRRVAITGNLIAAATMGAIPVLWATGHHQLLPLLGLVFAAGVARGPADSATRVMIPPVTATAGVGIDRGVALVEGASRTAGLLGAPAGGILIGVLGAANVVAVDAASFAAAAGLLLVFVPSLAGATATPTAAPGGPASPAHPAREDTAGYLAQLRDGFRYVAHQRLLRSIAVLVLVTNFADAALSGLLLLLWAQHRYGGTSRLGVIVAVMGAGAVAGSALVAARGDRLPRRWTFAVAFAVAGAPRFVVLALPVPLWAVLTVWGLAGLAAGTINPLLGAAEYETVPRALQARVLASVGGIAWAGIPFGALLAGALVNATSLTTALLVGAAVYALATLDPFLRPAWAAMNRPPGRATTPTATTPTATTSP